MKTVPILLVLLAALAGPLVAAKPMNIVVLYADDWRHDTPGKYQSMMKNYYRLATEVDSTCGRVIAELKKQGTSPRGAASSSTNTRP